MSDYLKLKAQIDKLQEKAEAAKKRELASIVKNIRQAILAFGLTAADLGLNGSGANTKGKPGRRGRPAKKAAGSDAPAKGKRGRKAKNASKAGAAKGGADKRSVVAPKYRDSASGATWTGRGKQPKWLATALKSGKKLEDFKI